jgi:hyperosmotically inducible periplasmic protein
MKKIATLSLLSLLACGCDYANRSTPDVDNSAINERDQGTSVKTPMDQNENQADIDITASIRRQVMESQMSTYAQNVKIVTQDGNVTLRGPVATDAEKKSVELIARKIAGDTKVSSELNVSKSN